VAKSSLSGGFGFGSLTTVQNLVIPTVVKMSGGGSGGGVDNGNNNSLIKSQTGSGKSLCYLVPIVNYLMSSTPAVRREGGTRALIISPTRELSNQIYTTVEKLTQCCVNIVPGNISGGEKKKNEKVRLRKGLVIVVSTPGRLLDHLENTESFNLTNLNWVVFDEADRLLDMGFGATINVIMNYIKGEQVTAGVATIPNSKKNSSNQKRHDVTLTEKWNSKRALELKKCVNLKTMTYMMCSATLTTEVHKLAHTLMGGTGYNFYDNDAQTITSISPIVGDAQLTEAQAKAKKNDELQKQKVATAPATTNKIVVMETTVTPTNGESSTIVDASAEDVSAPTRLRQFYMSVPSKYRLVALASFLRTHHDQKVIVFFATCDSVEYYSLLFRESLWPKSLEEYQPRTDGGDEKANRVDRDEQERQQQMMMMMMMMSKKKKATTTTTDSGGDTDQLEDFTQVLESTKGNTVSKMFNDSEIFSLHGKIPQNLRRDVIQKFTRAKRGFLFCTDVAARGIDLPSIKWILQFDPPCETNDYVHRCGRTARKGEEGDALLFLLPSELRFVNKLHSFGFTPEQLSLQKLLLSAGKPLIAEKTQKEGDKRGGKPPNYDELFAQTLQRKLDTTVHSNSTLLGAAKQCYRSFLRSYTTHSSEMKLIFAIQGLQHNHVARAFGLRESDITSYKHADVISGIIKGKYADKVINRTKNHSDKPHHASKKGGGKNNKNNYNKRKKPSSSDGDGGGGDGANRGKSGNKKVKK
jgi:ATP-dependent RNA helicase DDX31/DBP7